MVVDAATQRLRIARWGMRPAVAWVDAGSEAGRISYAYVEAELVDAPANAVGPGPVPVPTQRW